MRGFSVLTASRVFVKGHHGPLVPTTSFSAPTNELTLVQSDQQITRTALALVLSGRMKPTSGEVLYGHNPSIKVLRERTVLVDAVNVNEPENYLKIIDIVREDLSFINRKYREHVNAKEWLRLHGFADIADMWIDQVEPATRLAFQCEILLADNRVDTVVVDSPERHSGEAATWLHYLANLAERVSVVALVSVRPQQWNGEFYLVGEDALPQEIPQEIPAEIPAGLPGDAPAETPDPATEPHPILNSFTTARED